MLRTRGNPSEFIYELIQTYRLSLIKWNLVVQVESNSLLLLTKQTFLQERRVYFVRDLLFIWMLLQTGMYNLLHVLCQHHHAYTHTHTHIHTLSLSLWVHNVITFLTSVVIFRWNPFKSSEMLENFKHQNRKLNEISAKISTGPNSSGFSSRNN